MESGKIFFSGPKHVEKGDMLNKLLPKVCFTCWEQNNFGFYWKFYYQIVASKGAKLCEIFLNAFHLKGPPLLISCTASGS